MMDLLRTITQAINGKINWDEIQDSFSYLSHPMSRTHQDSFYHAEGDVWTHTKQVCEELLKQEDFHLLPMDEKQALFLAALLHDVGKVYTTRLEGEKLVSPNHALIGSKVAREYLWQVLGICGTMQQQQFRETVCNLIRYHSFPPNAIDDPDNKLKLLSIAANGQTCPMFNIKLLCLLCRADALGRKCRDNNNRARMFEQVLLCEELAKEHDCYSDPFVFPSDHTRYSYLSGRNVLPEIELYDDTWGEVVLMSGLPGSGKDTWIRENIPHLPMISLDEIRRENNISPTANQSKVVEIARERAKGLLRKKQPFVWNATNLSPLIRAKQIKLFTQYHASVKIVYLETQLEEQLLRNASRKNTVPESTILHMAKDLILPEVKEAHKVEWIIN